MPDDRLTLKDAADLLGYADASPLRHAIKRGSLKAEEEATARGVVYYTTRRWLDDYLASRKPWNQRGPKNATETG